MELLVFRRHRAVAVLKLETAPTSTGPPICSSHGVSAGKKLFSISG